MADAFGLLGLPASNADVPVGDPALAKIGAFIQAVANAQLTTAWLALRPRLVPQEQPAIRTVFTHDPDELCFNEKFLPALFVYRDSGTPEQTAEDWFTETTLVRALWVFPPEPQEKQRLRTPFVNAIAKAIADALRRGRHPAWVDSGDTEPTSITVPASPNSFLLAKPTQTSSITYSGAGLDGALGAGVVSPRLNLQFLTAAATGNPYSTTAPIVATYLNALGDTVSRSLQPTLPNGPEALSLNQDVGQLVSVFVPGQNGTTGSISIGNATRNGRGSMILNRAMLERIDMRSWKRAPVAVDVVDDAGRITSKLSYPSCQMIIDVREKLARDPAITGALVDPTNQNGPGVDVTYVGNGNVVVSQQSLPDKSS